MARDPGPQNEASSLGSLLAPTRDLCSGTLMKGVDVFYATFYDDHIWFLIRSQHAGANFDFFVSERSLTFHVVLFLCLIPLESRLSRSQ